MEGNFVADINGHRILSNIAHTGEVLYSLWRKSGKEWRCFFETTNLTEAFNECYQVSPKNN